MDFAFARHKMVENQVRANKVDDPVVSDAMAEIPREAFVPKNRAGVAYMDEAVQVADGRYLMEPLMQALLLQAAKVDADDMVLVVGGATGYVPALLSKMAGTVVAVESDADLAKAATETLAELGLDNVAVIEGALAEGNAKQGPYGAILIDGAVAEVPQALIDQLEDGGRLVALVEDGPVCRGTVITKLDGATSTQVLFDGTSPVLPGFEKKAGFVF